ncbi:MULTISPECIES: hypothetical protein [Kitasatospora]|uniref:DUF6924 domain-containing protein n=1 Tax=Kitasatospora setae (strain ATCC 33774 / DSM 43861 / JCM 3304 / KCC A-0304 / NBRC 14216 / KM-6054) TaxID=452652 RepID=E4N7Q5_KITSK|nr:MULTISPECIES: hypothetical protein [Kitasatospora]BAJ27236.1 hypothetical protein KSE_14080 [Kitasatospora setae KM-6054]
MRPPVADVGEHDALIDRTALAGPGHPLLAVTTLRPEDCAEPAWYEQETAYGTEFRAPAAAVEEINANLSIGNLGFEEFAAAAHRDPEGRYRPGA